MTPSSTSGRVKLNRTTLRKQSDALPKRRRSFSGKRCTLNTSVDLVEPVSVEEKITNSLELPGINIGNEHIKQELNRVNASLPKLTKVELQQAPEEDKETPGQAEGFSKGTEQPFDHNFQCGLKKRGTEPVQRITTFGDILERTGGPNTRSKSASGVTSFKACQLEKTKSERVKRHEKQVCCRIGFALSGVEEQPNKTRASTRSTQNQARWKAGRVLIGPGNDRRRSKEKSSLGTAEQTRPIRGRGVRAKTRRSKRLQGQRDSDAAHPSAAAPRGPGGLATGSLSLTRVVKKEKAHACGAGVWQQAKGGWHNGKVGHVRSSRRVVGTAETDAKSSKCMTQRRRQSDRVTENRIYKVPARKPNTAAFHLNSQQIFQDYSGENNNRRLIKNPCCTTCCDIKYTPRRIYTWARLRSAKPCKAVQAKDTNGQGLKKWENRMKKNPFVNLCDIAKASIVFVDQLNSTYVLTEELKINAVRCFKRHNGDLMPLDVRAGPCTSAEASQSQISLHTSLCAAHRLVNELPVVAVTETIGSQSHVDEKQAEKTIRLSGESIGDTAQDSKMLWGSDAAVQAGCSNAGSTSCESTPRSGTVLPFIPAAVKNTSSAKPVESENCTHKDGVQDNRSTMISHLLMVGSEESMSSGRSDRAGEREDESEGPDFFSCQRTNPSLAWARTRTSCARTYISWPFCQRVASTKVRNVSATGAPAVGPSTNAVSSVTLSDSLVSDPSVTDTPVSQNATLCCEMTDTSPSKGEASDIQAGTGHVRKSETNGNVVEKSPRIVNASIESDQITFESGHRGPTIEAAELQHDPILCSLEEGHPSEVVFEQGVSRVETAESQVCEPDVLWRPQQFRNPLKGCSSSVNRVENPNGPYPPALSRLLNGIVESSLFQSTWERHSTPAGLAQAERLPTVSQSQNFLEVRTAFSQGSTEDEDSSVSSSDELVDEALAPCGEIMCEIQDACASPCQEPSCHGSTAAEGRPSGEPIDLLKAYEQDAIVLDVIQDDPELFGNVFEQHTVEAVLRRETPLVSWATRPVKKHAVPTNRKITWNSGISATGNDDIGQQDLKKRGSSILPFLTDGNQERLCFDGGRPGLAGDGLHMDGSFPAQKGTTERTQDSVSGWLWTDLETSVQGDAWPNSAKAGSLASDDTWDEGLEGDTMQANVVKGLSRQRVPWANGSSSDPSETSEKYCKYYFSEEHCCFREDCWFLHLPRDGDERFCMDAVRRLCSAETLPHLQRAAAVFTGYYEKCPPGVHFAFRVLTALLSALLAQGFVKALLSVLRIMTTYKILPPVEFLMAVFEHVSRWSLRVAIPDLINVTARSVEAGLGLSVVNFEYMQRRLELLLPPCNQMEAFLSVKYRALETRAAFKSEVGELVIALTEVECCKEEQDWAKLGGMFCSMCMSDTSLAELNHLSGSIALALLRETPPGSPLPFCQFVKAVFQGRSVGGLIKSLLGRIGLSLLLRYYKTQQWTKGKQLLDALSALKVNYSMLKGLLPGESGVSRCRVLSLAAEVFLSCGSVESALAVLKDGEWTLHSPLWQCEEADVQHRRTVLYRLAEETTQKDMFAETLEVLTKLPDLQDRKVDNPQHNVIFHRHLKACVEKQSLTVASNLVELMLLKEILVDVGLLRSLVHKLGKQNGWCSARSLYKCALSMGCYPRTQVNKYCRLLPVPYSLSEVEMTLAIEMFMVTNANSIQNPGFFPHALQIVLKRKRGTPSVRESDYHAASRRLLCAAQTLNPKLVIKYATVNLSQEQVFTLDSLSAFKWLAQNINWASKDWLPLDLRPKANTSPESLSP